MSCAVDETVGGGGGDGSAWFSEAELRGRLADLLELGVRGQGTTHMHTIRTQLSL